MPATAWGWEVTDEELAAWTLHDDAEILVLDKPGGVVCHPSKRGPRSSLIGAAREYLRLETLHMPSRLDRETSGVVLFAKTRSAGSRLQRAIEHRQVEKLYLAILTGELRAPLVVDRPLGPDPESAVMMKQRVAEGGAPAVTEFTPLAAGGGYTLARVTPRTGRLHQIRAHAAAIGHPLAGDKLYGGDETLYLEFVREGFTERLARALPLPRHALHAAELRFPLLPAFRAPFPDDLRRLVTDRIGPEALYSLATV